MKIALYGGSFDPIHHGHLILAREAIEQLGIDRVIFIPAAQSPFKLHRIPAPAALRIEMVRAAITEHAGFECDASEAERPGPSYSVETVEAWRKKAPGDEIFYLIGQDNVADLHTWQRAGELLQLTQFIVLERNTAGPAHHFPVIRRRIDISATEIRKRVAENRSIRYLVPESVRAIIEAHHLYQGDHH